MERFKDRLGALVPYYDQQGGNATLIFTAGGELFNDHRTIKWNLRCLARLYSVDLEAIRRNLREFFHYAQGLPLPLSPSLVLVPLKTRAALGKNDGCHSYVNPAVIVSLAAGSGENRSSILLPGDHLLPCRYTLRTVQKRLRDGAIALERRRALLRPPKEPDSDGYSALLKDLARVLLKSFGDEGEEG